MSIGYIIFVISIPLTLTLYLFIEKSKRIKKEKKAEEHFEELIMEFAKKNKKSKKH